MRSGGSVVLVVALNLGLGLGLANLQGCAYGTAIHRGADAAAAGNWVTALEQYKAAQAKKPDGEEAIAGVAAASAALADAAVADAHAKLDQAAYEDAVAQVDVAAGYVPTHPELAPLRFDIEAAMVKAATADRDADKFRDAYALAARAKKLFPEAPPAPAKPTAAPAPAPAPEAAPAEPAPAPAEGTAAQGTPAEGTPAEGTPAEGSPTEAAPAPAPSAAPTAPAATPSEGSATAPEAAPASDVRPLDALLASLRTHYLDEVSTHRSARAFGEAIASARVVSEMEPDQADEIDVLVKEISGDWANDLVNQAKAAPNKNKKGVQAVLYARAFEVAGRTEDRDAAQRLAGELEAAGRFSLKTTTKGPRPAPYDAAVVALRAAHPEVVPATARPTLTTALTVAPPKCTEASTSEAKKKEYVAKTIQVPNPAKAEAEKAADAASAAWDKAKDALGPLEPAVASAQAAVKAADEEVRVAGEESTESAGKIASAKTQLAAATTEDLKQQWAAEVDKLEKVAASSGARVKAAAEAKAKADANLASATSAFEAGAKAEMDAGNAARKASGVFAKTPETLDKDVMDTFAYTEKTWTRTCAVTVSVAATPTWKSKLPNAAAVTASAQVTDVERPGNEKAGVTADPKKYGKDDAALVAEADTAAAGKLSADLDAWIAESYTVRLADADAAADPGVATEALVAMYLGASSRIGEDGHKLVAAHLAEAYGLKDPSLLVAPPAAAGKVAPAPGGTGAPPAPTPSPAPAGEGANN